MRSWASSARWPAVANYQAWPALPRFGVATLALGGLAWVVSFGTEQLGQRLGPGVTGVLQSTLGNLPELFVVIFALNAGELVVAQTAIIGSLFANALLVLGLVIVVGATVSKDGVMRFQQRLPNDTATLLLVTVFIIVIVGLSLRSADLASHHVKAISAVAAACLLGVYASWVVPYVRADARQERGSERPRMSMAASLVLLAVGGAASAFVSDWFVNALQPAIAQAPPLPGLRRAGHRGHRGQRGRERRRAGAGRARASPTWPSRWSRTRWPRSRPSCSLCSC